MSNSVPIAMPVPAKNNNNHVIRVSIPQQNNIEFTSLLKCEIYNRSRIVKFLSIIDIVFLIINFFISFYANSLSYISLVLLPLCLCGYKGAKEYKPSFIYAYIAYLFLMTMQYLLFGFYFGNFYIFFFLLIEAYY